MLEEGWSIYELYQLAYWLTATSASERLLENVNIWQS